MKQFYMELIIRLNGGDTMCGGFNDITDDAICFQFKQMDNQIMRYIHMKMSQAGFDEVTVMHGWILGFLYRNRDRNICQRDIEDQFCIAKSTVTNILKLMEKKGYVIRVSGEHDARTKVLHLTAEGEEVHRKTIAKIHSLHDMIENGITDEERECFYRIIGKIKNNMEKNRRKDG